MMMTGGEPMVLLLVVVVILRCGDDGAIMTILLLMTVMMAMMVSKDNHLDYLGEDNVRRGSTLHSQQNADTRLQKLDRLRNSGNRGAVDG